VQALIPTIFNRKSIGKVLWLDIINLDFKEDVLNLVYTRDLVARNEEKVFSGPFVSPESPFKSVMFRSFDLFNPGLDKALDSLHQIKTDDVLEALMNLDILEAGTCHHVVG